MKMKIKIKIKFKLGSQFIYLFNYVTSKKIPATKFSKKLFSETDFFLRNKYTVPYCT